MCGNGCFNKNDLFFIADCLYVLGLWSWDTQVEDLC
jgi:hypothetical protein